MYEPNFNEPEKELQFCLYYYRRLANNVRYYDGAEISNWLYCRDGIKDSIEKLRNKMDVSTFLDEIQKLDERIIAEIPYIQEVLDGYTAADEFDASHWWWYIDDVVDGKVKIEFNEKTGMYERRVWKDVPKLYRIPKKF